MSSKRCARCEKTVYPIEELKCLDKIWHKQCFKCQECGMTLNMKTYKGFNKLPYCNAHCPQAKHTAVADTPEIRRLAENTRIQSNVKYHEDFEKQRGKVTQVADDPETLRIRNTSKIISNVSYHGELERKKQMEQKRHLTVDKNGVPREATAVNETVKTPGKIADYDPALETKDSPYSGKLSSTVIFTSKEGPVAESSVRKIGSIADYDPLNENYGSIGAGYKTSVSSNTGSYYEGPDYHSQVINRGGSVPRKEGGHVFRAMYDYTAQDSDEVSFLDGDIIINCYRVDDGWMTGTVERTDQTGMLPANYVELIE